MPPDLHWGLAVCARDERGIRTPSMAVEVITARTKSDFRIPFFIVLLSRIYVTCHIRLTYQDQETLRLLFCYY